MMFGLRNAGATYQKAIHICLQGQIRCNTKVCVDDVVVKTRSDDEFIVDLTETFENLRRFKWRLNTPKCVFSVPLGKLLGFIMSN
jgi:hypothetical protein